MSRQAGNAVVEFAKVWGLLALVVIAGFAITYQYVGAPPPRVLRIATGAENGAYYAFGQRYARLLAKDGISLEVVPTAGSVDNIALLKNGAVSLALVQGGSASADDKEVLQSLGSMFFEPVWIFTRKQSGIKRFSELQGARLAIGAAGSGTYLLAMQLLSAAGISDANATLIRADTARTVALLSQGKVDAAFLVASPAAPVVGKLLNEGSIEIFNFDRASAYGHLFPFLTSVQLHEGVINLERNVPPHDTTLVAVAANLAARQDLNASLIPALLKALTEVHQSGGLLEQRRQFPSVDWVDLPLNDDAKRYITNGPSFLFRWLPYGTAVLLDRLKILIVPFLALLIPLFKIAPPLYIWRTRSKIYRWYRELREIDLMTQRDSSQTDTNLALTRLKELESEVSFVSVPLSYTGELYHLRMHIYFLQEKIEKIAGHLRRRHNET